MKKILISSAAIIALFAGMTGFAFAAKPVDNNAGAQKIEWNLSGAVMPVPPYGLSDITGSDTASKLIVNLPNGAVKAVITGEMSGLTPNTNYTVYLSKPYTLMTGWPGLYTSTIQPFTFTTDSLGNGYWHLNLTESNIAGSSFSVWINSAGGTILISNNVST